MRVGIVTITGSDNYGNVLQNYALQELLVELGCEVETIRNETQYGRYIPQDTFVNKFTPMYVKKYVKNQLSYRYNIKNSGNGLLKTILFCKTNAAAVSAQKNERKDAFSKFTGKYIHWSKKVLDINKPWTQEETEGYDFYISGSDQVWNPTYPSTSEINFLQFAPEKKRIAYAPSFGIGKIPEVLQSDYTKWLKEIPYLSVREEQGKKIIHELTGRDVEVLCDPTMTLPVDKWIEIERRPEGMVEAPYLLTYFLGDRTETYDKYIKKVADNYGLEIINLYDVLDLRSYAVAPQEFIYLIHHAQLVCTDSFHGAVFSILMHTNFVSFGRVESGGSMESRMQTLLDRFGLEQRNYHVITEESLFAADFTKADEELKKAREQAVAFLGNALIVKDDEPLTCDMVYADKRECFGCTACKIVCPVQCIEMKTDEEGFSYPFINESQCIRCGKCKTICPVLNLKKEMNVQNEVEASYIAFSNDVQTRSVSSSGGIFTELSKAMLREQATVFGAGWSENWDVIHCKAENEKELDILQGSKYVQSDMGNTYAKVKERLENGKRVYFSGTPCQVAGLYSFLGKEYNNLITQDVICHGTPSPLVWREYLKNFQNVETVGFRNKKYGWHYFSLYIKYGVKKIFQRLDENFFLRLFLDNTILRPICYQCPMKESGSCADITLADCWNPGKISQEIQDNDKGLSLVLLRTEKGKQLWGKIEKSITSQEVDTERALKSQSALKESALCNPKRAMFFKAFRMETMEKLMQSWYRDTPQRILKKKIIFVKTKIRFFLKYGQRR